MLKSAFCRHKLEGLVTKSLTTREKAWLKKYYLQQCIAFKEFKLTLISEQDFQLGRSPDQSQSSIRNLWKPRRLAILVHFFGTLASRQSRVEMFINFLWLIRESGHDTNLYFRLHSALYSNHTKCTAACLLRRVKYLWAILYPDLRATTSKMCFLDDPTWFKWATSLFAVPQDRQVLASCQLERRS